MKSSICCALFGFLLTLSPLMGCDGFKESEFAYSQNDCSCAPFIEELLDLAEDSFFAGDFGKANALFSTAIEQTNLHNGPIALLARGLLGSMFTSGVLDNEERLLTDFHLLESILYSNQCPSGERTLFNEEGETMTFSTAKTKFLSIIVFDGLMAQKT